jgi:transcriptional regulator with XRE-family HTH domain
MDPSRERIARNVFAIRTEQGFTQEALGALAGLHRTYIGAVERAEVNVSVDNVDRISVALSVDPSALLAPVKR